MKKTVRVLALLITLFMMTALFAGCNSDPTEPTATEKAATTTKAASTEIPAPDDESPFPLVDEAVEFTLWCTINPMATAYISSVSDGAVYNYLNELTNVHMVATSVSGMAARDLFPLMVNSGDWMDVCERVN